MSIVIDAGISISKRVDVAATLQNNTVSLTTEQQGSSKATTRT